MRHAIFLAALAVGCAPPPAEAPVEYRSTFAYQTRGLVLHPEGETGHAGMLGTNCPFETAGASVTGDYDLPEQDEIVRDAGPTASGPETVVLTLDDRIYLLNKFTGDYQEVRDIPVIDLVDGRVGPERGVVSLSDPQDGDCLISWYDEDNQLVDQLDTRVEDCGDAGLDVDETSGTVAMGTDDELVVASPDGSVLTEDGPADLVVWDATTDAWYVAASGSSGVRALDMDGTLRWETQVDGSIDALEHGGEHGMASVAVTYADGSGGLHFLDGLTGELVSSADTPGAMDELEVAPGGDVIALIREGETHFFDLTLD